MIALSLHSGVCTADMEFLLEHYALHRALMDFWNRPIAPTGDQLSRPSTLANGSGICQSVAVDSAEALRSAAASRFNCAAASCLPCCSCTVAM